MAPSVPVTMEAIVLTPLRIHFFNSLSSFVDTLWLVRPSVRMNEPEESEGAAALKLCRSSANYDSARRKSLLLNVNIKF